jgi:mevalonate kinase
VEHTARQVGVDLTDTYGGAMAIAAFGKVILLGEHAVVYDRPALAVAVSPGLSVSSLKSGTGPCRVQVPSWGLDESERSAGMVGDVLRRLTQLIP